MDPFYYSMFFLFAFLPITKRTSRIFKIFCIALYVLDGMSFFNKYCDHLHSSYQIVGILFPKKCYFKQREWLFIFRCTFPPEGKQHPEVYEKFLKIVDQGGSAGNVDRGTKWLLSICHSPVRIPCIVTESAIRTETHSLCMVFLLVSISWMLKGYEFIYLCYPNCFFHVYCYHFWEQLHDIF